MNQISRIDTDAEAMMATAIRVLAMDAVEAAKSGHPGAPMGMADVAAVLFNRFIKIDPADDKWPDRDRFVMSAGHGSMLVYAVNHMLGYDDMDMDQLRNFRQLGARTAGHPEYGHAKGIETTTGPLGQGITTAVGMALAERMMNARFGDALVDHHTYVICGDGCLMEGISHEAIDFAGHQQLGRLIVLWDDNGITIDGHTDLATGTDQMARFAASGWHVQAVDGHDREAVARAILAAQSDARPSMIACKTVIGYGAPSKQGSHDVHGAPLGAEEIAAARQGFGWAHAPFVVPQEILDAWRAVAARGAAARTAWQERLETSPLRAQFMATLAAPDAIRLRDAMRDYCAKLSVDKPKVATRKASEMALEVVNAVLPNTVGGSADLTGSNLTRTKGMASVTPPDRSGRYIHYGIREHGMAAIMNGIGLGEDGPTHQPVEQVASLRAIPNLLVFRPADAVETAEAWEIAVTEPTTPSVLCLSRQNLPLLRMDTGDENLTRQGAYLLRDTQGARDVTLIATGSEVEIALAAADLLAPQGVRAAVVSAPCFELFAARPQAERERVLGRAPRIGIEALIRQGWDGLFLRPGDGFIGMTGFGASAPAPALYRHFGITAERAADLANQLIQGGK
jgi:transketolase